MSAKHIFRLVYFTVAFIRAASLFIFLVAPLSTWILTFLLDTIDYGLALRAGLTFRAYQNIDKTLDFLACVYFVVTAYFLHWPHAWVFTLLLILRTIGDILYFQTRKEQYFFWFPNVIEFVFPLYVLVLPHPSPQIVAWIVVLSLILKLPQEFTAHLYKWIDPWSLAYIKKHPEHKRLFKR